MHLVQVGVKAGEAVSCCFSHTADLLFVLVPREVINTPVYDIRKGNSDVWHLSAKHGVQDLLCMWILPCTAMDLSTGCRAASCESSSTCSQSCMVCTITLKFRRLHIR